MSEIVNVLALVCAEDVLAKYGQNEKGSDPVVLDENCGGLIVAGAYGGGKALFNLAIHVPAGAQTDPTRIRWRGSTLSMNAAYRCSIENVSLDPGVACIAAPEIHSATIALYHTDLEMPKDPSKLSAQSVSDEYWESKTTSSGSAAYLIDIKISDEKGDALGYYRIGSATAGKPTVNVS